MNSTMQGQWTAGSPFLWRTLLIRMDLKFSKDAELFNCRLLRKEGKYSQWLGGVVPDYCELALWTR